MVIYAATEIRQHAGASLLKIGWLGCVLLCALQPYTIAGIQNVLMM